MPFRDTRAFRYEPKINATRLVALAIDERKQTNAPRTVSRRFVDDEGIKMDRGYQQRENMEDSAKSCRAIEEKEQAYKSVFRRVERRSCRRVVSNDDEVFG